MKKLTFIVLIAVSMLSFNSCREQTTGEKVEDAVEDVADDVGDALEDAGDEIEDAVDDN